MRAGEYIIQQAAHDAATLGIADGLARVEAILAEKRFLHGDGITESDVFLFPTAVRFDAVYAILFR